MFPQPKRSFARLLMIATVTLTSATSVRADDAVKSRELFDDFVQPLLKKHCYDCHSHDAGEASGGLVLDSRAGWATGGDSGPALVPGEPEQSLLLEAVRYENENLQMPPDGRLSDDEITLLTKWIRLGAVDPRSAGKSVVRTRIDIEAGRQFWSFQPIQDVEPPAVNGSSWPRTDIDRFLLARLEDAKLAPSPDASPAALLRRIYYDLTGLPPQPHQVEEFIREAKTDPDRALAEVVDRLLGSPHFGEKWGRHWLDLARYADSNGSSFNPPFPTAWRYRNWVIEAFNRDLPYDQFVIKQVAGDLLPYESQEERDENLIATAYLVLGSKVLGLFDKEQLDLDVVDEQIDTIGKSMLGMTLGCARCHDHKFDPIPQADYYALAGIFLSTATLDNRLGGPKADESDWNRSGLGPGGEEQMREFLAQHRHEWIKATQKTFHSRNKITELEGKTDDENKQKEFAKARQEYQKYSEQLRELNQRRPPYVMSVREADSPGDTELRIRGVPSSKGNPIPRGFLQVATTRQSATLRNPNQSGRLELARWIASEQNPLTARVYVNRVWKHLFRQGIVRSVDNFGVRGEAPTHPELLDHLASDFMRSGWSTKRLIRSLVLSRAYRMSTSRTGPGLSADPENRLLWRQNARRLAPEEIRDTLLLLSGKLDLSPGKGAIDHLPIGDISNLGNALDIEDHRRTVYQPVFRTLEADLLQVFDFANTAVTTGNRPETIVAPQALYLLNSPFVEHSSNLLAKRIAADVPRKQTGAVIRDTVLRILGREPTHRELEILSQYLERQYEGPPGPTDHDIAKLVQTILASTQFQFIE